MKYRTVSISIAFAFVSLAIGACSSSSETDLDAARAPHEAAPTNGASWMDDGEWLRPVDAELTFAVGEPVVFEFRTSARWQNHTLTMSLPEPGRMPIVRQIVHGPAAAARFGFPVAPGSDDAVFPTSFDSPGEWTVVGTANSKDGGPRLSTSALTVRIVAPL